MKAQIKVNAAHRLSAYASSDAQQLIKTVELVLKKHGIGPTDRPFPNPREYRKLAEEQLFTAVQKDFEHAGFKFKRLHAYTPTTPAVEADGTYQSIHYILDLVYRGGQLEVDLYY
jgi:hypothetical protein